MRRPSNKIDLRQTPSPQYPAQRLRALRDLTKPDPCAVEALDARSAALRMHEGCRRQFSVVVLFYASSGVFVGELRLAGRAGEESEEFAAGGIKGTLLLL